eukprot:9002842-Pyramimonas_sp.AAC.1
MRCSPPRRRPPWCGSGAVTLCPICPGMWLRSCVDLVVGSFASGGCRSSACSRRSSAGGPRISAGGR